RVRRTGSARRRRPPRSWRRSRAPARLRARAPARPHACRRTRRRSSGKPRLPSAQPDRQHDDQYDDGDDRGDRDVDAGEQRERRRGASPLGDLPRTLAQLVAPLRRTGAADAVDRHTEPAERLLERRLAGADDQDLLRRERAERVLDREDRIRVAAFDLDATLIGEQPRRVLRTIARVRPCAVLVRGQPLERADLRRRDHADVLGVVAAPRDRAAQLGLPAVLEHDDQHVLIRHLPRPLPAVDRALQLSLAHLRAPGDVHAPGFAVQLVVRAAFRPSRPRPQAAAAARRDVGGRRPRTRLRLAGTRTLLVYGPRRDLLGAALRHAAAALALLDVLVLAGPFGALLDSSRGHRLRHLLVNGKLVRRSTRTRRAVCRITRRRATR